MERNLKKESDWRKQKYKRLVVDVNLDYGNKFIEKLQSEGIKYSDFIKEIIYIKINICINIKKAPI